IQAAGGSFDGGLVGAGNDLTLNIANTITIADGSGVNNLMSIGETVLTGTINTTGSQTYESDVTIEGDVTINAGGDISFSAEVSGNQNGSAGDPDLIINTQANTTFDGSVSDLATLTTDTGGSTIAKADIASTGNQTYNDEFVLNTSLTLTGGNASFTGGIDGDGNDLTLNFTGNATLDGGATPISGINNLTSLGGVAANGIIATSAQQNYSGPVTLLGSSTFQGTTGTFTGGLNGNTNDLTLNFSSGTTIDGNSVFSNLGNLTSKGPTALNGTIVTNGSQTYEDAVELIGTTNLQGTSGTFAGGLDGKSNDLLLNFSDVTTIDGSKVFSNLGNLTSVGAVELNGTINTTGSQEYQNSVTLLGDTKLEGTSGTINGSLDGGNNSLTLDFSALTTINGSLGVTNLQNLTSVGDVALGGLIVTSGSQEYQQNISLISNTTLQGSAGVLGGSFDGGGHDFTMNFASTTTIGGGISNVANFTSVGAVDVTSDIATTGSQDYQNLVTLNANALFTGTSGTFTGGVDGNGNDLTLHFSSVTTIDGNNVFSDLGSLISIGDVILNGTIVTANVQAYEANMTLIGPTVLQGERGSVNGSLIGNNNDLTLNFTTETAIAGDGNGINNLTVVGPALLGASVTTIGSQEYQSPVTLFAATVLTGTNGTFTGGLNGNENDLTLVFEDTTTIDGNNVFSNLGNFTSHGDVNLNGTIVTKNVQTYEANMTLIGPTVLQGEQGVINGSLIGDNNDLTLNFTTETAIAGDGNGINNLTVAGPALLGASVTTIGSQEYQSPVTLSAATTLTGISGTFGGGLDGNGNDLTLNFSDVTTIDGSSTFSNLGNLTSKGDVVLNSTITTSGSQTYEQNVALSGATILVGQNGTFGGPIAGNNNDLTLNFGDTTTITGSQLQDIHNLIVGGGGSIETSGVVSTTGSQQYLDDIVLTGDTTLLSGSATISTQAITDNAANHTLTLGDAGQSGDIVL
ncbi:MAG: beta strand repeat-containing protein, partial [Pirellulales bacterium]